MDCFLQGGLEFPVVMLDSIAGDNGASAITAVLAMNEYRLWKRVHEREHLLHLRIRRPGEARKGDVCINNAGGPCFSRFTFTNLPWRSKIDNRFDAETLQVSHGGCIGLRPTKNAVSDLSEIQNTLLRRQPAVSRKTISASSQESEHNECYYPARVFEAIQHHFYRDYLHQLSTHFN